MNYSDFLATITSCPFCEQTNRVIQENNHAFLTYSIAPYHSDHLLVIPKRHVEHILDLNADEMVDINELQRKGLEILKKLGHVNMSLLVKEGDMLEKSVAHTHFHVIPDILLESSDHAGSERVVLTDAEVGLLISRIKTVC